MLAPCPGGVKRTTCPTLDGARAAGTSKPMTNSDASPDTAPWRAVWVAYADPSADPAATWSLIAAAAGPLYAEGLADTAVRRFLAALLAAPTDVSDPFSPLALDRLAELRERTLRSLVADGETSFYGAFGEFALHRAVLRGALARPEAARAAQFLAEVMVAAAEYLVGRDQIRLMPSTGGIKAMSARRDAIVAAARAAASAISFGAEPLAEWPAALRAAWGIA